MALAAVSEAGVDSLFFRLAALGCCGLGRARGGGRVSLSFLYLPLLGEGGAGAPCVSTAVYEHAIGGGGVD